jgi:hypothetical protein
MNTSIPTPNNKDLRNFGIIFGSLVALIFGLALPFIFHHALPLWPWIVLGVFLFVGLLIPRALKPIYYLWMYFGLMMSKITTPLIMGIAFFIVIFPIGVLLRIFKTDPLGLKLDKNVSTYRVPSEHIKPDNLEKPF